MPDRRSTNRAYREDGAEYTLVQTAILRKLSDGMPHSGTELAACLWDPSDNNRCNRKAVSWHIKNIREKLRPKGQDIVCVFLPGRRVCYRHVILLKPLDSE